MQIKNVTLETGVDSSGCLGKTKKKKPCKGNPLPGYSYCRDHMENYGPDSKTLISSSKDPFNNWHDLKRDIDSSISDNMPKNVTADLGASINQIDFPLNSINAEIEKISSEQADSDAFSASLNDFEEDDVVEVNFDKVVADNPDEVEENDCLQHMRDVFEFDEVDSEEECEESEEIQVEDQKFDYGKEIVYDSPEKWSWSISYTDRWNIIQRILDLDRFLIILLTQMLSKEMKHARENYKREKIKANSTVYEGKALIGGTIVGCISRLEAIRALNPFAILVEEASEVMEPLLFSCLGPTTCKLEMIGLKYLNFRRSPSVATKYNVEV